MIYLFDKKTCNSKSYQNHYMKLLAKLALLLSIKQAFISLAPFISFEH